MKKQVLKTTFASIAVAAVLTSCGSSALKSAKKMEPLNNDVSDMPKKVTSLEKEELKEWPMMDMNADTVPGMSVHKAYDEIIKDHEGKSVVVAVLDAGVDVEHEDLKDVAWVNKKETADNEKDDDENGFVDDIHGWNFLGDITEDNLEYTRLVRKLKPKYEDKTESQIAEEDLKEYKLYKRALEEYEDELNQAKQQQAQYGQMKMAIENSAKLVAEELDKDKKDITPEDLKNIDSDDDNVAQAQGMLNNIFTQSGAENSGKILEELSEADDYFATKLDYHLNLEFEPRKVLGDDEDDIEDNKYGDNRVGGVTDDKEEILHGTHVAGIIGATRNNDIGMDGVANNVELMAIRSVSEGDEYDKDIALGIRYAVDNGAKIINMSFGKYYSPHKEWVIDAIKYAEKHDVLLVNAAGNESNDLDTIRSYPNDEWPGQEEIVENMITVGALNVTHDESLVAPFSNYGKSAVDVFAPGMEIYATTPLDEYEFLQGTSMAAPNVAGIAAMIRSYFPKLSAKEVKEIIMESGITTDIEVNVPGDQAKKPFNELSKSGKMANLYNALILAAQK